jgi:hypothetical protein
MGRAAEIMTGFKPFSELARVEEGQADIAGAGARALGP